MHVHDHSARVVAKQLRVQWRRRDGFVGQGHALPAGLHDLGRVAPGGRETGGPTDGQRVARWRRPEAAASVGRIRRRSGRRRLDAGKADGALDRGPTAAAAAAPAHRAVGARQPRLQYGLVAERQVAVDVIVRMVVRGVRVFVAVTAGPQHGPCPAAVVAARHLEPVAAVLVAVAVLAGGCLAARVPGLAREHGGRAVTTGGCGGAI